MLDAEQYRALLGERYSVRDFAPTPVPDDVLAAILDDARHCASWSNTRPYRLAIATGDRLRRISDAYVAAFDRSLPIQRKEKWARLKAVLRRELPDGDFKTWAPYPADLKPGSVKVGKALYAHLGIGREDRAARDAAARRNCELFGAPVGVWVFAHEDLLPFSAHDAGLMLQTLMLSATARGLGTCPMGVLATWRHPVAAEFEIPEKYKLITGLGLGYPSDHHVNSFRAEHPEVGLLEPKSASE